MKSLLGLALLVATSAILGYWFHLTVYKPGGFGYGICLFFFVLSIFDYMNS